jgi:hypothetical protein
MGLFSVRSVFVNDDNNFNYLRDVEFEQFAFQDYLKLTEETFEKDVKEQLIRIDEFLKSSDLHQIENEYDYINHETLLHTHKLYYGSLFISLYSFLERKLYAICIEAQKKQTIKIKDISGDGIFKYEKYLKKVVGIDLTESNTEWTIINQYNKLRNRIIHSPTNTIEKLNNERLITQFRQIEFLNITDEGTFIVYEINDVQLLKKFIKVIDKFLRKIYFKKASFR